MWQNIILNVRTNEYILYRFSPTFVTSVKEIFSCQLLRFFKYCKELSIITIFLVRYSISCCLDCTTCPMMEYIIRHDAFFLSVQMWECPLFDIFWLNHLYSLIESKIQILLLKHLSQISEHILLELLILSCYKNKPISSRKVLLASERAFALFRFAGVLVGIVLGSTQSNKEGRTLALSLL